MKLGQRIGFPNQYHAKMVLDCDSNSRCLDVFKLVLGNRNLHQTSIFLLAGESLPLHRRRPYHLHTLRSTGAHAGELHPSMRRSLPFPRAANSRSIPRWRDSPLHAPPVLRPPHAPASFAPPCLGSSPLHSTTVRASSVLRPPHAPARFAPPCPSSAPYTARP